MRAQALIICCGCGLGSMLAVANIARAEAQPADSPQPRPVFGPLEIWANQVQPRPDEPQTPRKSLAGPTCPEDISTHTDAPFEGALNLIVFGGLFEGETVAASYTLSPDDFPLQIITLEAIFGTFEATIPTTTHWTALVWEGTPDTGTLVGQISSDGVFFAHLEMPAGSGAATLIVPPLLPIIVTDNGTQTFSIGFRIDQHNQPPADPCDVAPNCCNAFPTVDVSGVASNTGNWLNGLDCGLFGCPPFGGWANFLDLGALCSPSGDWIIRATWVPLECDTGACCTPAGTCQEATAVDCSALGGTFQGVGTDCAATVCEEPTVACCFAGGNCLDLGDACCMSAGGDSQGPGTTCAGTACVVTGACCFPNDFCLELDQNDCEGAGALWQGSGTGCSDGDGNGVADDCEFCPADLNGDNTVDALDLAQILGAWGDCP